MWSSAIADQSASLAGDDGHLAMVANTITGQAARVFVANESSRRRGACVVDETQSIGRSDRPFVRRAR
jgi:hypothetical protein